MPVVAELFGQALSGATGQISQGVPGEISRACRTARCPFMDAICDGGGNRDMARVKASDEALGPLFDKAVGTETKGWVPCGICSVRPAKEETVWAICPRRLLTLGSSHASTSQIALASRVYEVAGFRPGQEVSIWSELSLRDTRPDGKMFNYRLDYVLRSTQPGSPPVIVEIMTCSTSGGNRSLGTDIQGAFRRSVLFVHGIGDEPAEAPGVNVRQVWARMASQMIAKSQAANSWGGRTIWVVQDRLVEYIRKNTALPLDELYSPEWKPGEVNMLVSDLEKPVALYAGPIRPSGDTAACWMDLLGAPHVPPLASIDQKLNITKPIGTFHVPDCQ